MSSLLPPLLLAIAALGGGWWLGAPSSESEPGTAASQKEAPAANVSAPLPSSGLARRAALFQKLENLSLTDIQRLLNSGKLHGVDLSRLAEKWAKQDPGGMWRWLESGGRRKLGRLDVSYLVFTEWMRSDPDAAIIAFRSVPMELRSHAAWAILNQVLTVDDKLRQKLLPLINELMKVGNGAQVPPGTEMETAAKLLALPASRGRDTLLAETARAWLGRDLKGATAWVTSQTEPLKSKIMASLAAAAFHPGFRSTWSASNKDRASDTARLAWAGEWLTTTAPPEVRRKLGVDYVKVLAESDPAAALAWSQENLHAGALIQAFHEVLVRQAAKDPSKSRALVDQLPPGPLKQRATFSAAGPPNADSARWLLSNADPGSQEWSNFGSMWASDHPDDVRKFVTPQNVDTLPKGFLYSTAVSLASKDPEGTLTWAANLESADLAGNALQQWSHANPLGAAAWVKDHPGTPVNESGVSMLAGEYFRRSASDAVEWAASLAHGPARDAFITAIRKHLSSAPSLKPDQRAALEAKLGKP